MLVTSVEFVHPMCHDSPPCVCHESPQTSLYIYIYIYVYNIYTYIYYIIGISEQSSVSIVMSISLVFQCIFVGFTTSSVLVIRRTSLL